MRTEEEAEYDREQRILELYDRGISIPNISKEVGVTCEYIQSLFNAVQLEPA